MPAIKRSYLGLKSLLAAALTFCLGIIPGLARSAQSPAHQGRNPLIQRLSDSRTYDALMVARADTSRIAQANSAWRKSYQANQANRKIFVPPENWVKPETKHKATQRSESNKLNPQPKQAIRLSPARQPQQAIRLSPARQPQQAIRLSPAKPDQ
jgi:hypothetical protein